MRTLLNESLPPHLNDHTFTPPEEKPRLRRTFSDGAVLAFHEPILMEVGVGETGIAAPGAGVDPAHRAPGRGTQSDQEHQLQESSVL